MNNLSKPDFSGQHIYVGMDVHKKSWSISIVTEHSTHKMFSQPPDPAVLSSYMQRNFPGATYHAAYEAGYSGFWIHDQLHEKGIDCMVVNPVDVPTKDKERSGKTDKVDCRKLARCLRNGELEGIYVPARVKVEDRGLLRSFSFWSWLSGLHALTFRVSVITSSTLIVDMRQHQLNSRFRAACDFQHVHL